MKTKNFLALLLLMVASVQSAWSQSMKVWQNGEPVEFDVNSVDSVTFTDVKPEPIDSFKPEWVDLGLPSGTLWATCNVGAKSPEAFGDYFAWGETQPKEDYTWATYQHFYEDKTYGVIKYCTDESPGYNGFTDGMTELEAEDDAATANWGSEWQMPSKEQLEELLNDRFTEKAWTSRNNVQGLLISRKGNTQASIFLPAAGSYYYGELYGASTEDNTSSCYCYYWSRSLASNSEFAKFLGNTDYSCGVYELYRYNGFSVRPVRVEKKEIKHEYVDLGLPSNTLWATCNVGADNPEDVGEFFAWGETEPKETYSWDTYKFCQNGNCYMMSKYCVNTPIGTKDDKAELDPEDDAATANWGSDWMTPSQEQLLELLDSDNTTRESTTLNGISGMKVTSKKNGKSIFLPRAEQYATNYSYTNVGAYWSRTLDTSNDYDLQAFHSFFEDAIYFGGFERCSGLSVRPVRERVLVESITLNINETKIYSWHEPRTVTLTATVLPENATNKAVKWESTNTKIAVVSEDGVVSIPPRTRDGIPIDADYCYIICRATDGSGVTAVCKVYTDTMDPL